MEFWVEVYEYGELIDRLLGISFYSDEAKSINGQLAILINHNSGISWTFTTREGGASISHTCEISNIDSSTFARAFGPIDIPVIIEPDKEIVLYTSIYSTGNISTYVDMQRYLDEPELLSGYPYVQIIKCKFTN